MNADLKDTFPEFNHHISEVQKFIRAGEIFTLRLKTGEIIHLNLENPDSFEEWLTENGTINIKNQ